MKKTIKRLTYILVFLYWSFSCYDHFKSIGDHARNLMEWVGVAGEEGSQIVSGALK